MKRLTLIFCAALAIAACNNASETEETKTPKDSTTTTPTPTTEATEPAPVLDSATMMKNWMDYATPGEVHKMMASWNGNWDGEVTMWETPTSAPQKSTTKAVNKMIFGGRYQISTHTGNMMGMPFEGQSIVGYDNGKKQFVSSWIDNMGTGIMYLTGPWDSASKSITLTGKMVDPSAGNGHEVTMKEVLKIIDDNTQIMEMYYPGKDGKEFKTMEIKSVRKK
ncbi:MAG: hypothetical protein DI535_02370 [Citrobacter freundii]|nr:MAG: hypothetical protein DI535_02370 [Citrobacter freundii]